MQSVITVIYLFVEQSRDLYEAGHSRIAEVVEMSKC